MYFQELEAVNMPTEKNSSSNLGPMLELFSHDEISEAIRILVSLADSIEFSQPTLSTRPSNEHHMALIIQHNQLGAVSVKSANLVISWKKLLFAGGAMPLSYMSSTLTAMTILGVLVKGVVHVFDEVDAKILAVIHLNSKSLPTSTEVFYEDNSISFPTSINKELFMERVTRLSGYGVISIDGDQLVTTESTYSINFIV